MQEPKLPKFRVLKFNPHLDNKIIVKLGGTVSIMVDPRYFAFYLQNKKIKLPIVVNHEYTPNRSAHTISILKIDDNQGLVKDLVEMDLYSRAYQKYLKELK